MELSARKQAILTAVVQTYIKTGEPIGSKLLSNILNFGLSSATLRNEMSELCELGLLEQPHTSAGRIPSVMGYKMYADSIVDSNSLSDEQKQAIDLLIERLPDDPQSIPSAAAELLSEFTGLASISATSFADSTFIKHVQTTLISRRTVLIVLIASNGVSKTKVFRSDVDLTEHDLDCFNSILEEHILSKKLNVLDKVYLQNIVSSCGWNALRLSTLLSQVFSVVSELKTSKLYLKGQSNLFGSSFSEEDALRIIKMLSNTDSVVSMLNSLNDPINVIFANSSNAALKSPPCMIIANCISLGSAPTKIGVIGPTRISYESIIPSINYFSKALGAHLDRALKYMED